MTTSDAARRLGVSQERVSQMLRSGVDGLWRKVAQQITVRRFTARHPSIVEAALVLTGELALEVLEEPLVGRTDTVHGYLRGGDLEDVIDDAGLVEDAEGDVAIYLLKADDQSWLIGDMAPRALVAADCARSGTTRVHAIGIRALEDMRRTWLTRNT